MVKLSNKEMYDLADILDAIYVIEDNLGTFRMDGYLSVQDILKAADYIRNKHPEL